MSTSTVSDSGIDIREIFDKIKAFITIATYSEIIYATALLGPALMSPNTTARAITSLAGMSVAASFLAAATLIFHNHPNKKIRYTYLFLLISLPLIAMLLW